jgi:hypothetical protein
VFFDGAPLWHVSVAVWSPITHRPKLVSSWTDDDKVKAERYALNTLRGVGVDNRTINEAGDIAVHYRRQTTTRERDYVFKTNPGRAASLKHERG